MKIPLIFAVICLFKIQVFAHDQQLRFENLGDVAAKDHRATGGDSLPKYSKDQLHQRAQKIGDAKAAEHQQQNFQNAVADQQQHQAAAPSAFKVENAIGHDNQQQQQQNHQQKQQQQQKAAEHLENKFVASGTKSEQLNTEARRTVHEQQQQQAVGQQAVQQRTDELRQQVEQPSTSAIEGDQQRHARVYVVKQVAEEPIYNSNAAEQPTEEFSAGRKLNKDMSDELFRPVYLNDNNRFATAARIVSKVFGGHYYQPQQRQFQYQRGYGHNKMGQPEEQREQFGNAEEHQQRVQFSGKNGQTELLVDNLNQHQQQQYNNNMGKDSQSFKSERLDSSRGMQRVQGYQQQQQQKLGQDSRAILGDLQQQNLEQDNTRTFQGEHQQQKQQKLEQGNSRTFQGEQQQQQQNLEQSNIRTFQGEQQHKLEQDSMRTFQGEQQQKLEQDSMRTFQGEQQHQQKEQHETQQFEQQQNKQQEPSLALERARLEELRIKERARVAKLEAERQARLVEIQARERQAKLEAEMRVRNVENRVRQAKLEAEARANQAILEAKVRQAERRARLGHGGGFADASEELQKDEQQVQQRQQQQLLEQPGKFEQQQINTPQQLRENVAQPMVAAPVVAVAGVH
ncbi:hypothetical protein niasHS_005488 [Heterodera schachtii]|uniref:Uncharacterized protein n=1 Tax=Heterodera schachtii TaxID=97005 RepID=A0ABD2JIX9_HETSC